MKHSKLRVIQDSIDKSQLTDFQTMKGPPILGKDALMLCEGPITGKETNNTRCFYNIKLAMRAHKMSLPPYGYANWHTV